MGAERAAWAGPRSGEAAVSDPLVAVTPVSRSRVHLDVGMGMYTQGNTNHTSAAFALGYEYGSEIFGWNLRIPFGIANSSVGQGNDIFAFLMGDIGMRFRWRVLANERSQSHLSIGFEVTLPVVLLNSLGGKRTEIYGRRIQNPVYQAGAGFFGGNLNILPLRYLYIGPQVAFAQKLGPVTLGAHLLGTVIIASDYANLYESPHVEFILTYDLYAVYNILGNRLLEAVLEFGGNSIPTKIATDGGLTDAGTGLTLTFGLRSRFAKRFEVALGFQVGLPVRDSTPNKEKRGYDLSAFYRHDWSLLFRFGVLL